MEHYKSIFLGSSPLFLIYHKLLNQKEGNSLLIEKEDRIGGAWYTSSLWGIENIELGCHILKNIPSGIDIMKHAGVPLKEMEQQPSIMITKYGGESKINAVKNSTLKILKSLSRNKLYSKYKIQKLEGIFRKKDICKFHYLDKGCYELIQSLDNEDVNITRGQKIKSVKIKADIVTIELENGKSFRTNQLFLPKNFHLDSVEFEDRIIEFEYSNYISEHYILKYPGRINTFSFIDVLGDELINLVGNVGIYTDSGDNTILAVAVKKPTGRSENNLEIASFDGFPTQEEKEKTVQEIEQKLKSFGVLPKEIKMSDFHYEPYILNIRKDKEKHDLTKMSNGSIQFLDTTDLVESLLTNNLPNVS